MPTAMIVLVLVMIGTLASGRSSHTKEGTRGSPSFVEKGKDSDVRLLGLNDYIRKAMLDWSITGLSIAVVDGSKIVFARGYGVRDVRTGEPVDYDIDDDFMPVSP